MSLAAVSVDDKKVATNTRQAFADFWLAHLITTTIPRHSPVFPYFPTCFMFTAYGTRHGTTFLQSCIPLHSTSIYTSSLRASAPSPAQYTMSTDQFPSGVVPFAQRKLPDTIVLADVDLTLSLPRQLAKPEMLEAWQQLRKICATGVVGGSNLTKIEEQLKRPGTENSEPRPIFLEGMRMPRCTCTRRRADSQCWATTISSSPRMA